MRQYVEIESAPILQELQPPKSLMLRFPGSEKPYGCVGGIKEIRDHSLILDVDTDAVLPSSLVGKQCNVYTYWEQWEHLRSDDRSPSTPVASVRLLRRWFEPATRTDWKNEPFPEALTPLDIDKHLSVEAYESLKLGRIPQEMEDKWFAFWEADWLYFYRSWTGLAVFKVRFEHEGDDFRVAEAWRETNGVMRANDSEASGILLNLLEYFEHRAQQMQ